MVYIEAKLLLGSIVEIKRSDGSWVEGVISDVYLEAPLLSLDGRNDNDYFTVTFADGRKKKILMQQELAEYMRPVHDTAELLVSQMKVLQDRKRSRDSADSEEEQDFGCTQESQTMLAPSAAKTECAGQTMQMPPLKKSCTKKPSETQLTKLYEEELSDDDLLAACLMFENAS